jgi:uncharacterized protein YeaO (DUF488 family)
MDIQTKRIYLAATADDGCRVLVDRLWPRGIAKAEANIDLWLRDIAPSNELRRWFGHEAPKWDEFRRRYQGELAAPAAAAALQALRGKVAAGRVTLLFAASDVMHNNAVALHEMLTNDAEEVS